MELPDNPYVFAMVPRIGEKVEIRRGSDIVVCVVVDVMHLARNVEDLEPAAELTVASV